MAKSPLTDAVAAAIKSLEQIQKIAHDSDRAVEHAENRAADAAAQAAKDREVARVAESKVDGLEARIIHVAGRRDAEFAALKASNEVLSKRDREARDELDRLRHMKTPQKGINSRLSTHEAGEEIPNE